MLITVCHVELIRRQLRLFFGAAGGCAVTGAVLCGAAGPALADPADPADPAPPGCTAADLARVSGTVATETSGYLFAHPDVNEFFTGLKAQPSDDFQGELRTYMDAHPQAHTDLRSIRQPLIDLQQRCNWTPRALTD